ncbi:hypothetical protein IJ182_06230 [bacterium]|nr:hypothetical protein [bacterium]
MYNTILTNYNNISFNGLFSSRKMKENKPSFDVNIKKRINNLAAGFVTTSAICNKAEVEKNRYESIISHEPFFKEKGKITWEAYNRVKENSPELILKAKRYTYEMLKSTKTYTSPDKVARLVQALNKKISNDVKIISIGTSPSFITEPMSETGKDVTIVPISNANLCRGFSSLHDYFEYYPNLKLVGEYLKYKGITKDEIKDRNVIILDYSSSGRTLQIVKRLVNEYCGIPDENIQLKDISELIEETINTNTTLSDVSSEKIKKDIFNQKVEKTTNVAHFSIFNDRYNRKEKDSISARKKEKTELFKEFDDFSKPSARAYQLCVLDEISKINEKEKF